MATFKKFQDIDAWKKARELNRIIFRVSEKSGMSKDYVLSRQIKRSSLSIMSNIAEGFERDGKNEFIQFLSIAKGSTGEVITQLYAALDAGYINQPDFDGLFGQAEEIGQMLGGLIQYLKKTHMKGWKYRGRN